MDLFDKCFHQLVKPRNKSKERASIFCICKYFQVLPRLRHIPAPAPSSTAAAPAGSTIWRWTGASCCCSTMYQGLGYVGRWTSSCFSPSQHSLKHRVRNLRWTGWLDEETSQKHLHRCQKSTFRSHRFAASDLWISVVCGSGCWERRHDGGDARWHCFLLRGPPSRYRDLQLRATCGGFRRELGSRHTRRGIVDSAEPLLQWRQSRGKIEKWIEWIQVVVQILWYFDFNTLLSLYLSRFFSCAAVEEENKIHYCGYQIQILQLYQQNYWFNNDKKNLYFLLKHI